MVRKGPCRNVVSILSVNVRILRSARQFSLFSVLGDSQESLSSELDELVEVGGHPDESEPLQPSFNDPSEVFQAAEDHAQTTTK